MALFRAQILLEDYQHEQLEMLARESSRSMSDLVREIVAEHLYRASQEESLRRSLAAVDKLTEMRRQIEREHGCLETSFLDDMREERDSETIP